MRHDKDSELECKATSLKEKQHLEGLALEWIKGDVDEVDVRYDEKLIKIFGTTPNLKHLELKGYMGVRYPSWLSSLKYLVHLISISIKKCQIVPPLHQFPSLRTLELIDFPSLEYVSLISKSTFHP